MVYLAWFYSLSLKWGNQTPWWGKASDTVREYRGAVPAWLPTAVSEVAGQHGSHARFHHVTLQGIFKTLKNTQVICANSAFVIFESGGSNKTNRSTRATRAIPRFPKQKETSVYQQKRPNTDLFPFYWATRLKFRPKMLKWSSNDFVPRYTIVQLYKWIVTRINSDKYVG